MSISVRQMRAADFSAIIELCGTVYPGAPTWVEAQLYSHFTLFPEGQLVAVENERVLGYAACLILNWDNYTFQDNWRDMTDGGLFTNHDPTNGRTLYGAEVMVHPSAQGKGAGGLLYEARVTLMQRLRLLRIRAGARLIGYGKLASQMTAQEYVLEVVQRRIVDPTLSFQLNRGFQVLAITSAYLRHDPESLGYAAVIERINPETARPEDYLRQTASPFYRAGTGEPLR